MRVLYLPVEVTRRELNSKLLIAITALNNNSFDCVFCGRDVELFQRMAIPGVVLLKSMAGFELKKIEKLKKHGHIIFSLDEEGVVPPLNDPSINSRFSEENLNKLDGLLSNGPLEILSYPEKIRNSAKIQIVGNPRFDFYKKERRIFFNKNKNKIRKSFRNKKIILLASRFGDVNLYNNKSAFDLLKSMGYIDTSEAEIFFKGFFEHGNKLFTKFLELPSFLAKNFPEYMIVVRPHPSEDHAKWLNSAKEKNIVVTADYDIASWLACADCLIHNGCTTAVEAVAMQVPVITFMPEQSDEYDLNYPNEMGLITTNLQEVKNALNNLLINALPLGTRDIKTIIDFDLNENASNKIVKAISAKYPKKNFNAKIHYSRLILFYIKNSIRYFLHGIGVLKDYSLIKYPFEQKRGYFRRISSIQDVFDLNVNLDIRKTGIDIIKISRKKA